MHNSKFILVIVIIFQVCTYSLTAQSIKKKIFEVGEELVYQVSYSFIKLGEIRTKILEKKPDNSLRVQVEVESYQGLPFKGINERMESLIDKKMFSKKFSALHLNYEPQRYTNYDFDYRKDEVKVKKGNISPFNVDVDSTFEIKNFSQDGISILYYARYKAGQNFSDTVNCFIVEKNCPTVIDFIADTTSTQISSVDYDINCVKLSGMMDFVGLYGLTGYFEGWFSNDEYSIPIVAKLNVFVGSVNVELISWSNQNWTPPRID